jgi:site-specific recombinase XerD
MHASLTAWQRIAPASPYGLVWPEPNGEPRRAKLDRSDWYKLQERANVSRPDRKYLLHEARHAAVTLLLELDVDPGVIKAIVGHSNIITTRGYQTVRTGPALEALARAGERLGLS